MHYPKARQTLISLAVASACAAAAASAMAQEAPVKAADAPQDVQSVVVTGLRQDTGGCGQQHRSHHRLTDGHRESCHPHLVLLSETETP
jgi:Spy/CpxP family protein refolding chaperone